MLFALRVAVLFALGVLYLVGSLALSALGITDFLADPDLDGVWLVRVYELLLTGFACLMALLHCCSALLPCCRDQPLHSVTMSVMFLASLYLLAINGWELATAGWHWSVVGGALLALNGGMPLVVELVDYYQDRKVLVKRWALIMESLMQFVFGLHQVMSDDADLLQLAALVVTHGTALAQLAAGLPLLLLGGMAVCAALLRRDDLELTFRRLGVLLLVLWVMVVALCVLLSGPATQKMEALLFHFMDQYGEAQYATNVWDVLQSRLHCCRVNSSVDWGSNGSLPTGLLPWSCYPSFTNGTMMPYEELPAGADPFITTGCLTAARQLLPSTAAAVGWMFGGVVFAFPPLMSFCSCFAKSTRNRQPPVDSNTRVIAAKEPLMTPESATTEV